MSSSPQHPAFYPSRRQLWANLPGVQPRLCTRLLHQTGLGSNCDTLHAVWGSVFTLGSILWLIVNAIRRYCAFKSQAYDPRFGSQWDETVTLNTQLVSIIIGLALLPIMVYSATSRTGHLANDSIILGRDVVHLQKRLSMCGYFRQLWRSAFSGSTAFVNVLRGDGSPLEDETLEKLLVKRKGRDFYARLIHAFRPFSTIIYVLMVYCLLTPVSIMEAEQMRNEAIHPRFVFHSNLDGIFGQSPYITQLTNELFISNRVTKEDSRIIPEAHNERPFPAHQYPTIPAEVSLEYALLAIGLASLTIRYATPFYFTSRSFASVLSVFTAISGVFILVDNATVSVVYKIAKVGIREPGGADLTNSNPINLTFPPLYLLVCSALGVPAVLLNLMAVYAYGEEEFDRAVTNYAQLLMTGQLPQLVSTRSGPPIKTECNGNLSGTEQLTAVFSDRTNLPFGNTARTNEEQEAVNEVLFGLPLTIAVTTKFWRPPPTVMRRNSRATRRSNTPIPGQILSAGSENSSTLKRTHGMNAVGSGSAEMMASMHTLTEMSESTPSKSIKRSNYGQLSVAGVCFVWLLVTRIVLIGPVVRCFWNTSLRLALINILVTVLFLISWLLIWFGLGIKNAWRFRLLHVVPPLWGGGGAVDTNQAAVTSYGIDGPFAGVVPQLQPAFPVQWPIFSYPPWITNAQNCMAAGLNATDSSELQRMESVLPNGELTGIPEAGSGGDSLYGCFNEADVNVGNPHSTVGDRFGSHLSGLGLRAGPPTLSDESDDGPVSADRNLNADARYYKRMPGSASFTNGLSTANNCSSLSQRSFSPSPFNKQRQVGSRNTSPMDGALQQSNVPGIRMRCQNVTGSQSTLSRPVNRSGECVDTTYATLAPLPRPTLNHVRPPSVNALTRDTRGKSPPVPPSRNMPCRRNGSRVTFQDGLPNGLRNNPEGANGSSDSGVYTNSHGTAITHERPPIRCGRLKSELLERFEGYVGSTSPISPTPDEANEIDNGHVFEDAEMSTDMTSFAMVNVSKVSNRTTYISAINNGTSDSGDHLCSQV